MQDSCIHGLGGGIHGRLSLDKSTHGGNSALGGRCSRCIQMYVNVCYLSMHMYVRQLNTRFGGWHPRPALA